MKKQRKLHNYLIKRKMQVRITAKFVFFALISSLLSGIMVYLTLWPTLSKLIPPDVFPILQANIVFTMFCASVPIVLIIFVSGIIITHRVAGPLYNIENKLDKAIRGEDIGLICLRKGDELEDLAQKVNTLLQKLKDSGH
ncbi:MAG: hypothetical protein U9N19_07810 [Thermodesulfobacteriota bacterium]|nr:hypothetical protein [Thermodesulfobacteriota bacterium]